MITGLPSTMRVCVADGTCHKRRLRGRLAGEMRPGVVVEGGGNPALRIVAVRTGCLPGLCELAVMSVFVTIFATCEVPLNCISFLPTGTLWTIAALDDAVRSE